MSIAPKTQQPNFYLMTGIGKARYVVNYHNGVKTHKDGSPFYDIALFGNKRKAQAFMRDLRAQGYQER